MKGYVNKVSKVMVIWYREMQKELASVLDSSIHILSVTPCLRSISSANAKKNCTDTKFHKLTMHLPTLISERIA